MSLDDFDSQTKWEETKTREREQSERDEHINSLPNWSVIDISKEEFNDLKSKHTEAWIRNWLVEIIRKNKMEPPYTPITEELALTEYNKMKEYDTTKLFTNDEYYIKHDVDERWDIPIGKMISQNNTGNKSSNYFHERARFKSGSSVAESVEYTWYHDKLLSRTLNAIFTLKMDRINHHTLQQAFQLRRYIPSQFKPIVAKAIYDKYEAVNVYDMSMGWGDRLAGFSASKHGKYYYGADPNTNTFPNYLKQKEFYNDSKEYDLFNLPAEDLTQAPKYEIDLAFSSPPYFTKEHYSDDRNQSWKRYPHIKSWLEKFLFKAVEKQYNTLRSGGTMIINISDVYIDGEWNKICDPMNEFISRLDGSEYVGHMGMKLAKRPNVHSAQDGNFAEPMWIWRKH